MKTWIKILALGLVLCMTVAMIAACGAPAAQGNESGTEAGQETARETEKDTEGQPGKETETDKPGDKETVKETDKATETEPETDPPVTQSAFGQPLAKYTRPFASNDATYFTGVTQDDEGLLFSIGSVAMVYKPASIVYDISGYTHFEFDLYVEDSEALRNLGGTSQIELTSGGQNDKGELSIEPPKSFIPKIEDGWNHVSISLSDMAAMADFDPTGINYLRWYWVGTDGAKVDTIVKDMKFTNPASTDAPAGYFEIEGQTFNWEAKSEIYKVNQNTREKLPFMFEDKAHWNANQVFCDGGAYVIFKFPAAEYRTPVFTFDICQNYRLEISNDGSEWVELLNYSTEDGVTGPISSADNRKTVEIDPAEYGLSSDEDVWFKLSNCFTGGHGGSIYQLTIDYEGLVEEGSEEEETPDMTAAANVAISAALKDLTITVGQNCAPAKEFDAVDASAYTRLVLEFQAPAGTVLRDIVTGGSQIELSSNAKQGDYEESHWDGLMELRSMKLDSEGKGKIVLTLSEGQNGGNHDAGEGKYCDFSKITYFRFYLVSQTYDGAIVNLTISNAYFL